MEDLKVDALKHRRRAVAIKIAKKRQQIEGLKRKLAEAEEELKQYIREKIAVEETEVYMKEEGEEV